jgi:predicted DNA-binding transcriptional regulator YafY
MQSSAAVIIDYTNYRGERGERRIVPLGIHFWETEWHPERQWILRAFDMERELERQFAMKDIHSWRPAVEPA